MNADKKKKSVDFLRRAAAKDVSREEEFWSGRIALWQSPRWVDPLDVGEGFK